MNTISIQKLTEQAAHFVPKHQLNVLLEQYSREDTQAIIQLLQNWINTFNLMPVTYDTDLESCDDVDPIDKSSVGENVAYLHYFVGGFDWWITERDVYAEQLQAFGIAKLTNPEFGYINLVELCNHHLVELDLYWTPTKLKDIPKIKSLIGFYINHNKK